MLLYKQQQIKIINKRRKKDVRTFKICEHTGYRLSHMPMS